MERGHLTERNWYLLSPLGEGFAEFWEPESEWSMAPTEGPSALTSGPGPSPGRGTMQGPPLALPRSLSCPGALWLDQGLALRAMLLRKRKVALQLEKGSGMVILRALRTVCHTSKLPGQGGPEGCGAMDVRSCCPHAA